MTKKAKKTRAQKHFSGFRFASVLTVLAVMAASHLQVQAAIYVQGMEDEAKPKIRTLHSGSESKFRKKVISGRVDLRAEERHGDYINYVQAPPAESTMNDYFFNQEITKELKQRYESFNEKYEFKKNYGISGWEDHYQYQNSNRDLMDWVVKKMTQYHIEHSMKNAPKDSEVARTVTTAVRAAQAVQGSSLTFSEDTKARFKYDLPRGKAMAGFTSPVVDASVDYLMRPVNQLQQPVPGVVQQEKLSASVSKSFDKIGAGGGARYGLSNKTMNYYVNKHLVGPLSAQVDQVDHLGSTAQDETIYRLNFGIGF